jgi:predicted  nucleic acid-binding Zn-ribbon protein
MRLVRFEDPIDGVAVDLHPLLTVVTGAHHGARERLLAAVAALPRGTDPGASGSVEVHGVMLDLNLESLGLLELHDDLDVVVRAGDLPTHAVSDDSLADTNGAAVSRAQVLRAELAEARAAYDEALAAVEEAEALRADLRRQLAAATDQRRWLQSEIEGAHPALSPTAEAELHAARDDLAVLRQRSEDAAVAVAAQRAELEDELARAVDRVDDHQREMARLAVDRTPRIRTAIDELTTALDPELVPSNDAIALADELDVLDDRLAMLESRAATGRAQVQELTARRDAAYDAFVAAEAALRSPDLDTAAVSELEGIHDEIFELDGRIAKLSAGRLRRRMLELRDRESELLGQLGFESWSSYVMGMSSEGAETERKRRYDVAKATYEFAEDEVAKAAGAPMAAASELADARQRRREILVRAESILGHVPGDDPSIELRAHREPVSVDLPHAVAALRSALDDVGAVGIPFEAADALAFARNWLVEEAASRQSRATEVAEAHRAAEAEVSRLTGQIAALPDAADLLEPLPDDHPEVMAAQSRIDDLINSLDLHRKAVALVAEFEALEAEEAQREEELSEQCHGAEHSVADAQALLTTSQSLTATLEAALADLGHDIYESSEPDASAAPDRRTARSGTSSTGHSVVGLEWYVLARLAQQRSLSFVGSVPLAIDDAFSEWTADELAEVHGRLARMSEVIQVVYLSDDVDVVAWARDLGHERASVVDLSS